MLQVYPVAPVGFFKHGTQVETGYLCLVPAHWHILRKLNSKIQSLKNNVSIYQLSHSDNRMEKDFVTM